MHEKWAKALAAELDQPMPSFDADLAAKHKSIVRQHHLFELTCAEFDSEKQKAISALAPLNIELCCYLFFQKFYNDLLRQVSKSSEYHQEQSIVGPAFVSPFSSAPESVFSALWVASADWVVLPQNKVLSIYAPGKTTVPLRPHLGAQGSGLISKVEISQLTKTKEFKYNDHDVEDVLTNSLPILLVSLAGLYHQTLFSALDYAKHREQGGRLIWQWSQLKQQLSNLIIAESTFATAVNKELQKSDASFKPNLRSRLSLAIYGFEHITKFTADAMQIYGGAGYIKDFAAERYFRFANQLALALGPVAILKNKLFELYR